MPVNLLSIPWLVVVIVSLLKPFIDAVVPQKASLHDPLIRVLAIVLAIGLAIGGTLAGGMLTFVVLQNDLGSGLLAGLVAILTYHVTTNNLFATNTPTPVPPLPLTGSVVPLVSSLHVTPSGIVTPSAVPGTSSTVIDASGSRTST